MSRRKIIVTVAVAAMLVLAGCSTGTGGLDDTTTEEPTTVETTTVETTTAEDGFAYPSGLSEEGITNPNELASGYQDAVLATSFEGELSIEAYMGGESRARTNDIQYDGQSALAVRDRGELEKLYATSDGEFTYTMYGEADKANYAKYDRDMDRALEEYVGDRSIVVVVLNSATLSFEGIESHNGEEVAHYTIDSVSGDWVQSLESVHGVSSVDSIDGDIYIDSDGVVHSMEYTITGPEHEVSTSFELSHVGDTTVEEPSWLSEAQENGLYLTNFQSHDGYISFEVASGSIESGTMAIVDTRDARYPPADIEQTINESSTVYMTVQDGSLTVTTNDPGSGELDTGQQFISMFGDGEIVYQTGVNLQ